MGFRVGSAKVMGEWGFQRRKVSAVSAGGSSIQAVQAFSKAGSSSVASETISITADTTVGHHMIVMIGVSGAPASLTSVTDSRGNTYTVNYSSQNPTGGISCFIASCKLTTALLNGDVITITPVASGFVAAVAQQYSGMDPTTHLRTKASNGQGWATVTAAGVAGTTAGNSVAGDLVLGVFVTSNGATIATPGSGYSNETGVATTGTVIAMDWESKTAVGGTTEAATATMSTTCRGAAGTIVWAKA